MTDSLVLSAPRRAELLERSRENKAAYDKQRLDNFYERGYNINKIAGAEVLPEPCDPRDPEFGYKCGSRLPRLPQERTDPFDPRSDKYAPRRGAVFGLNDLNIEFDEDFPGGSTGDGDADTSVVAKDVEEVGTTRTDGAAEAGAGDETHPRPGSGESRGAGSDDAGAAARISVEDGAAAGEEN